MLCFNKLYLSLNCVFFLEVPSDSAVLRTDPSTQRVIGGSV